MWKCTKKSSRGCNGSLSTSKEIHGRFQDPKENAPHNHAAEPGLADAVRVKFTMCENAARAHAARPSARGGTTRSKV